MNNSEPQKFQDDLLLTSSPHDEDQDWTITFVDLITLLLGFFVILYSLKSSDVSKYEKMTQSIRQAIGEDKSQKTEVLDYGSFYQDISDYIKQQGLEDLVEVSVTRIGVEISTDGGLLFDPGSTELNDTSINIVKKIASTLIGKPFFIQIEGHTDAAPIATAQFPTNWELSAARAARVVRLMESLGIAPNHLSAVGYADTRLKYPEDPLNGANRRVVFVVTKL